MRLTCPHCGDPTDIPDDRLPPRGARGACRRCGRTAVFDGLGLAAETDATPPNSLAAASPPGGAEDSTPVHPLDAVGAPTTSSDPGAALWHASTPKGQAGPLSLHRLKEMVRTGELTEIDHVFGPGDSDWKPAGDREELRRYFAIKAAQAGAGSAVAGAGATAASTAVLAGAVDPADPFAWCSRHERVESEWLCASCRLSWCADCPSRKQLPTGTLSACPKCDRPLGRRERPKPITLWWTELGEVFRFPIKGLGWIALILLSLNWLLMLVSSAAPGYGQISFRLLQAGMVSWFVLLVREVGLGGRSMPDLGKIESWKDELLIPGIKALLISILALLPLRIYTNVVALPAVVEYGEAVAIAQAAEEASDGEEAVGEWAGSPRWEDSPSEASQREAFADAMRNMGASEEEIEQMLAEFDAEGGAPGGEDDEEPAWEEEPWKPEKPGALGLLLKLLGVPALMAYALVLWPLLFIIVALFNTIAPAFNPPLILRIAKEVWPEYKRLLWFLAPMLLVLFPLSLMATTNLIGRALILAAGVPVALQFLAVPLYYYLVLVMLYAIGRTAELIDRKIDWF